MDLYFSLYNTFSSKLLLSLLAICLMLYSSFSYVIFLLESVKVWVKLYITLGTLKISYRDTKVLNYCKPTVISVLSFIFALKKAIAYRRSNGGSSNLQQNSFLSSQPYRLYYFIVIIILAFGIYFWREIISW